MTTRIDPSTDFEHPIIDSAWDYEVIGLRLEKEPIEEAEPFLDLRRVPTAFGSQTWRRVRVRFASLLGLSRNSLEVPANMALQQTIALPRSARAGARC